jgi:hypothetical protein
MDQEVSFRKVSIRPIELLKEAKSLLGDQYWLFVGIVFVGILIGSLVPLGILMGPMMCGIYLCYLRKSQNQQVTFDMLFKGMDYFVEGLIVALINIAVMVVVTVPMYLIAIVPLMAQERPGLASLGVFGPILFVVLMLVYTIIILWFLFAYLLIVDRGLQAIPAIKASGRAGLANVGGLVGMLLLYGLISCLGACCCYVPAVLFSPLFFGAIFLAYREIFPAE